MKLFTQTVLSLVLKRESILTRGVADRPAKYKTYRANNFLGKNVIKLNYLQNSGNQKGRKHIVIS